MKPLPRALCVVIHDVAPATWEGCRRLLDDIGTGGRVPVTLLAVPRYHGEPRDGAFESWLRDMASAGDEVALHGLTHRDNGSPRGWIDRLIRRHYTASEGEFSGLSSLQAARRLSAGARWMRSLALPLDGFIAPAWLLSDGAWQALRASPFSYTCTLGSIQVLPRGPVLRAQSQVFSSRSGWRRLASILWNVGLAAGQRRQPVVRLELHPVDAEHAAIRACWRWLLKWQLRTREATTLSCAALRLRGSEQQQHEFGGGQSDERTCRHVTRIVKTEHDA